MDLVQEQQIQYHLHIYHFIIKNNNEFVYTQGTVTASSNCNVTASCYKVGRVAQLSFTANSKVAMYQNYQVLTTSIKPKYGLIICATRLNSVSPVPLILTTGGVLQLNGSGNVSVCPQNEYIHGFATYIV